MPPVVPPGYDARVEKWKAARARERKFLLGFLAFLVVAVGLGYWADTSFVLPAPVRWGGAVAGAGTVGWWLLSVYLELS